MSTGGGCPLGRWGAGLFGFLTYLVFAASFGLFVLFVGDVGGPFSVQRGTASAPPVAVALDLLLLLSFAVPHSVLARASFKRWWSRRLPAHLERSFFVLVASLSLALIMWQWRPLPYVIWEIQAPAASGVVQALFWMGWAVVLCSTLLIDHLDLTGLRQVFQHWHGRPYVAPAFAEPFLYRVVRHPMMLGLVIAFWAAPRMTGGRLILAAAMTLYILVGVALEERDLVRALGDRYRDYQARVPRLVPLPGRPRRGTGAPQSRG